MSHDQTYIAILGAALRQANINALVLAQNGPNQLGRPYPGHPGFRNWDGNLISVGHLDKDKFVLEADAILPGPLFVDLAYHQHAHLNAVGMWVRCQADADGAVPITITITQTRDTDEEADR